jgi:hypothetical protein
MVRAGRLGVSATVGRHAWFPGKDSVALLAEMLNRGLQAAHRCGLLQCPKSFGQKSRFRSWLVSNLWDIGAQTRIETRLAEMVFGSFGMTRLVGRVIRRNLRDSLDVGGAEPYDR